MRHIHRYRSLAWLVLFVFMFTLVPVLPDRRLMKLRLLISNAYRFRDARYHRHHRRDGFGDTGHVIFVLVNNPYP